jgi:integrase
MPQQLPSCRWRTRVRHPRTGKQIGAHTIIGGPTTHADEKSARDAENAAAKLLIESEAAGTTLAEFWHDWTTDPLWLRPAESTNIHNKERTQKLVAVYGHRAIRSIGDDVVAEWLKGGKNLGTVAALRAMFNDASTAQAGRLVAVNPFANLGLRQSKGRKNVQPPSQVEAAKLIELADELTPPSFAAYLHTAMYEGIRPGEGDALRWAKLDFTPDAESILVDEQWNAKSRKFTVPKHGIIRTIAMTEPARDRLLTLPRESEFVFATLRGTHYTPSSRNHHWNRVRAAAGLGNVDLYTCTRHYFASYAWNELRMDVEDIADHFGHQDGGKLVRELYGHLDSSLARARVRKAFASAPAEVTPLRRVTAA